MMREIDPSWFPLGELPFDTFCRITNPQDLRECCVKFTPSTWYDDLKLGGSNRLLYWYPIYVANLFEIADNGMDYKEYLNSFNLGNSHLFNLLFPSTVVKLDKLKEGKVKLNHLSETKVKIK